MMKVARPTTPPATETKEGTNRYRAPALEKGLDVLELLATTTTRMTLSQISTRLDRSINELFRMVQVLETRGYVAYAGGGDGYELTPKLFSLALAMPTTERMLSHAVPLMQDLSDATNQACHLAVASGDQMVVIARVEAPGSLSFSVRVGFRRELVGSTSGVVLYAFQRPVTRETWRRLLQPTVADADWQTFEERARLAVEQGFARAPSTYTEGILDISCPIYDEGGLAAALTMPLIRNRLSADQHECLGQLRQVAIQLSRSLGATDMAAAPFAT